MQWPLTSQSHGSILKENDCFFSLRVKLHALFGPSVSGVFRGGFEVLVRAKLALSDGVTMQVTVRSENPDISELITSTIG
jgi:hypothetical protein